MDEQGFFTEKSILEQAFPDAEFTFMKDVLRNVTINPSENLTARCPHCGRETVSGVQFPNGITALFNSNKPKKKFGTR